MDRQLLSIHTRRPPLPSGLIERERLVRWIEQAVHDARIVLVSAPAGSGKSTLLVEWAHQTHHAVAWLTIESSRLDATQFLRYLLTAWNAVEPALRDAAAGAIIGAKFPDLDLAVRSLANFAVIESEPVIFVLDDIHQLHDPRALELLTFFIEHTPPGVRFLLGSRGEPSLPLARLQVRHGLARLDGAGLAFDVGETARMLGNDADDERVRHVHQRTAGWAAGLRLLASESSDEPAATLPVLHAYLTGEVLAMLEPGDLESLAWLGIVETICPELGDAILGEPGAGSLLARLAREQLFVQPLDLAGGWYRFHPLLFEALQTLLPDEARPVAHRRAADWFLQEGRIDDAVQHAVASGSPDLIFEILDSRIVMLLEGGDFRLVRSWVEKIPDRWYIDRPELNFLRVAYLIFAGEIVRCRQIMDDAEIRLAGSAGRARVIGRFEAARCAIACFEDEVPAAERHAARAFAELDPHDVTMRANTHHALADSYRRHGRWDDARRHYFEILRLSPADPAFELRAVHVHGALADLELRRGALQDAAAHWRQAIGAIQREENWGRVAMPVTGWAYIRHGELLYEWNQLEEAAAAHRHGMERAELGGDARAMLAGHLLSARLALAAGHLERAAAASELAGELDHQVNLPEWSGQIARARALVLVARGDGGAARSWMRSAERAPEAAGLAGSRDAWLALAHVRVVFGEPQDRVQARANLTDLIRWAEREGRLMVAAEARALLALADQADGEMDAARNQLGRALELAELEGPVRRFIDLGPRLHELLRRLEPSAEPVGYVRQLQAACPTAPVSPWDRPASALSERELEILRMIGAGLTNKETAERLFISPETVKRHLANIYDKLDAHRRTEALLRARELGLLP